MATITTSQTLFSQATNTNLQTWLAASDLRWTCCPHQQPVGGVGVWMEDGIRPAIYPATQCGGCGTRTMAPARLVTDPDELDDAVLEVSIEEDVLVAALRAEVRARLRRALDDVLADLDGVEDEGAFAAVATGSDDQPGVYYDGGWVAWDYDPSGRGDIVEVTA